MLDGLVTHSRSPGHGMGLSDVLFDNHFLGHKTMNVNMVSLSLLSLAFLPLTIIDNIVRIGRQQRGRRAV